MLIPILMVAGLHLPDLFKKDGPELMVRYSQFYRGDDDAVGTCLIYSDDTGLILGTGLTVFPKPQTFTLTATQQERLEAELENQQYEPLQTAADRGDLLPATVPDMAVSSDRFPSGWEQAHKGAGLEKLVKEICDLESAD